MLTPRRPDSGPFGMLALACLRLPDGRRRPEHGGGRPHTYDGGPYMATGRIRWNGTGIWDG